MSQLDPTPYVTALPSCVHPQARRWWGDAHLRRAAQAQVGALLRYYGPKGDRLAAFAQSCPVPGALPGDYAVRQIEVEGVRCLMQARFYGTDTARPFVALLYSDAPLEPSMAPALRAAAALHFGTFAPLDLQIWAAQPGPWLDLSGTRADQLVLAGDLQALMLAPPLPEARRLQLIPADLSSYLRYAALYEDHLRAHPQKRRWLSPLTREEVEPAVQAAAWFEVQADGEPAGFIGAAPSEAANLQGWVVMDEILGARHLGQGLGAAMQQRLVEALDPHRARHLIGTIDAANVASLATARRVGRVELGGWVFASLPA